MTARKKTIAGELVTRIGEEHSGFHLLGDCDFNNKNIYGPLNIVDSKGNAVGVIDISGNIILGNGSATDISITFDASANDGVITFDESANEFTFGDSKISTTGDFSATNISGTITTATQAQIDHDSLLNFLANEHIDWTNASANFKTTGTVTGGNCTFTGKVFRFQSDGTDIVTDFIFDGVDEHKRLTRLVINHAVDTEGDLSWMENGVLMAGFRMTPQSDRFDFRIWDTNGANRETVYTISQAVGKVTTWNKGIIFGSVVNVQGAASFDDTVTIDDALTVSNRISSAQATITPANDGDAVNVASVNSLMIDCSGGNVIIGAFIGGVEGQVLYISRGCASANDVTLEHNEGTGNQNIFLHAGADETLGTEFGGWVLVCNGTSWFDTSHAKHV